MAALALWKERRFPALLSHSVCDLQGFLVSRAHARARLKKSLGALEAANSRPGDALLFLTSPFFHRDRNRLAELALQHRLPSMFANRQYTDAGGMISYGPSYPAMYRLAAEYVDKVLKGAAPADLPIQQPTKFELVINLETAKALGLRIPQTVLLRADEVIE